MKKLQLLVITSLICSSVVYGQEPNWNTMNNTSHLITAFNRWDYGIVYGVGYGYKLPITLPVIAKVQFSIPAGETILDDFKSKIGGQVLLYKNNFFFSSASIYGIARRYENPNVRLFNFGGELTLNAGWQLKKGYLGAEAGWDKAIVTSFKHSSIYKESFPEVKDGWYEPTTGGNVYIGLISGYSFGQNDLSFSIGLVEADSFERTPFVPYYLKLGYNRRF